MFDLNHLPPDLRARIRRVAAATGFHDQAVFLVFFAIGVACRRLPESYWLPGAPPAPEDAPTTHLTAVEVCDAVCRCARARVGDEAARFFRLWDLRDGKAVGRIVYGLIAEGLGSATEWDRPEQFDKIPLLRLLNPVRTREAGEE